MAAASLNHCTLFSGTHLQVRPADGFSRLVAQTTRTREMMCLLGVSLILFLTFSASVFCIDLTSRWDRQTDRLTDTRPTLYAYCCERGQHDTSLLDPVVTCGYVNTAYTVCYVVNERFFFCTCSLVSLYTSCGFLFFLFLCFLCICVPVLYHLSCKGSQH